MHNRSSRKKERMMEIAIGIRRDENGTQIMPQRPVELGNTRPFMPTEESETWGEPKPVEHSFRPRRPRPINRDADDMSRDQIDPIQERVERGEVPYPERQAMNSNVHY